MAIIHQGSVCAICGEKLDRPFTATSGLAFGPDHRLFKYCDAPLHFDCLETWTDRLGFSLGYYQGHLQSHQNGYGSLLYQADNWFLACGPEVSGLPYFAKVELKEWPNTLYSKFDKWTKYASGEYQTGLVGEALTSADKIMAEVSKIAPDTNALTNLFRNINNNDE